jgi:hypothetical protein
MKRTLIAIVMAVAACGAAFAQEAGPAEPEQTDILIPPLILEVPELAVEEVRAVLPNEDELALGQISLPLPGADELSVANLAFDVPLPTAITAPQGPAVFSTGRLGAGTSNRLLGELQVFKLGTDPRFRLGFAHDSLDGFQSRAAGTGFDRQSNSVDAWVSVGSDTLTVEGEVGFTGVETGLQNQSDSIAVETRTTSVTADLEYRPDPLVVVRAEVDGLAAARLESVTGGSAVPRDQEYTLLPSGSATVTIRSLDLIFRTSYFLRLLAENALPLHQDADLTAGFELTLPRSVALAGHAGIYWDFTNPLEYPWSVSARAVIGDALEVGLAGGYRVERTRMADLWVEDTPWTSAPLIAVGPTSGPTLATNSVWYGRADGQWSSASGLSVRSTVDFRSESAVVDLAPYDTTNDEFPFVQRPRLVLVPAVGASWQLSPAWQVEAGWTGHFIDRVTNEPSSEITGAVRFANEPETIRADAEVSSALFPQPAVPELDLRGTFVAGEGVEFVLELRDILSPLFDDVPLAGAEFVPAFPFIRQGFVATLYTRITL